MTKYAMEVIRNKGVKIFARRGAMLKRLLMTLVTRNVLAMGAATAPYTTTYLVYQSVHSYGTCTAFSNARVMAANVASPMRRIVVYMSNSPLYRMKFIQPDISF